MVFASFAQCPPLGDQFVPFFVGNIMIVQVFAHANQALSITDIIS